MNTKGTETTIVQLTIENKGLLSGYLNVLTKRFYKQCERKIVAKAGMIARSSL
jgi:hypothetical protein